MLARFALLVLLVAAFAPRAWAAGAMPAFFTEVVCLVVACAAMAFVCHRLGQVPILGFLISGVALNAVGLVRNPELVEALAEVGVILLLFTIGIEFSVERLMQIKRLIFIGGGLQVAGTVGVVAGALMLFGVGVSAAIFTGMLVSLSSTAIVLKLLESRGETRSDSGQIAVGMLIFQDLAVVGMVIAVPLLGGGGGGAEKLAELAVAVVLVTAGLLVARRLVPKVLELLAKACSQEIFLLGVIAICLGTAFVTGFAGVSLSLGAFLAGLLVSESRFGSQALGEILPLQILFSATFFVSVGLLLDVGFLVRNLPLVLGVVAGVLLLKAGITFISGRVLGAPTGTALASALLLAQVGEFSFVLERAGREVGLAPAGLDGTGGQTFIASTVVLMALTPFLAQAGQALGRRVGARPSATAGAAEAEAGHGMADHVLILGYGRSGRWLALRLLDEGIPARVITLSPTGAAEGEAADLSVLRGDYTKLQILVEGGLRRARAVVIADDTLEVAERAVAVVRGAEPDLPILTKTSFEHDARELDALGATFAVSEEAPGHRALLAEVLVRFGRAFDPRRPRHRARRCIARRALRVVARPAGFDRLLPHCPDPCGHAGGPRRLPVLRGQGRELGPPSRVHDLRLRGLL